jgi:HAD superfamily hydrolase (TIGR01509 family)
MSATDSIGQGGRPSPQATLRALLWDVDGTLAETERDGHREAFNDAFAARGLRWRWDGPHYGALLRITGGRERLLHDMAQRPDAPAEPSQREALAVELHALKNRAYAGRVACGAITLRPGVGRMIARCVEQGIAMGIVTTTSRANVQALMRTHLGPDWQAHFAVTICGEDVERKKPDPQAYRAALEHLGLDAHQTIALEDSPAGAAAASAAGIPVVVTRSAYFPDDPIEQALAIGPGLDQREGWQLAHASVQLPSASPAQGIDLQDLISWHHAWLGRCGV